MTRPVAAAALTAVLLVALLGSWLSSGWSGVRAEQAAARAAPRAEAERTARALAGELAARLEDVRRREDGRPYYHYQSLFHDPRGAAAGASVAPSPLADGPDDPLIAAHFQLDAAGRVSLPTLNEDVPELNIVAVSDNVRLRDALAAAAPALRADGGDGVAVALADPSPGPGPIQKAGKANPRGNPRVEVLDEQAYLQNAYSQQVYQQTKSGQAVDPAQLRQQRDVQQQVAAPPPRLDAARDPALDGVAVTVAPLDWRAAEIAGAPALVAVRRVDTPDGTLTQGLVVTVDTARELVTERDPAATVVPGAPAPGAAAAPLDLGAEDWHVVVDDAAARAAAEARADGVARAFLVRFVPTATLALACGALVVLLVARAERAARQRARFAAAAAHELRTPLAGLQLYGDMLADGLGNPERARDYARRMSEEASRLGRVVTNVLDFSRLERGGLAVTVAERDLGEVVTAAVERARPQLERAGCALQVELPDAPVRVRADDDAVARIVGNLLDNAEKYGRGAADRTIVVRAARDGDAATIAVGDAGPGLSPAAARQLFRPFARGVAADGPAGLGLGLALSRTLAQAMGGDLCHQPTPGGGATFVVRLPAV